MSTITFSPLEAAILSETLVAHRYRKHLYEVLCPEYQPEEIESSLRVMVGRKLLRPLMGCFGSDHEFFIATASGQAYAREYGRQMIDQWRWSGVISRAA